MVMNQKGCCCVCGSSDNNNCIHFAHPLRPVNHKLTNTAMGVQPSQRLSTKAVSNSLRNIISDQNKIANIVLNPPFIKLDRREIPLTLKSGRRVPSPQPTEEDSASSDDDSDPDYNGRFPTIRRSSNKNENVPISQKTEITISRGGRMVPTRQCKTTPNPLPNNGLPSPHKTKGHKNKYMSAKRKRLRGLGVTNRPKPSRASLRLYHQLKRAAGKAAQVKRSVIVRISRSVELVNQTTEGWREEKSKLLFMVALGLTPIPNKTGVILPSIKIQTMKKDELEMYKQKYEQEQAEWVARLKEERRQKRLRRFDQIRNWRLKTSKTSAEAPVEVIDLASDDESKDTESTEMPESIYILPDEYPNLTIEVSSTSRSQSHQQLEPQLPTSFVNNKPFSTSNFAQPTLVKRIGYGNINIKNRVRNMCSSFSQRQTPRSPSRSNFQRWSLPNSTKARKRSPLRPYVFPGPSPTPVAVTPDDSIPTIKRTSSSPVPVSRDPNCLGVDPLSMVETHMHIPDDDIILVEDD